MKEKNIVFSWLWMSVCCNEMCFVLLLLGMKKKHAAKRATIHSSPKLPWSGFHQAVLHLRGMRWYVTQQRLSWIKLCCPLQKNVFCSIIDHVYSMRKETKDTPLLSVFLTKTGSLFNVIAWYYDIGVPTLLKGLVWMKHFMLWLRGTLIVLFNSVCEFVPVNLLDMHSGLRP